MAEEREAESDSNMGGPRTPEGPAVYCPRVAGGGRSAGPGGESITVAQARLLVALALVLCGATASVVAAGEPAGAARTTRPADDPRVAKWERDVAALEALDARAADPPGAILFVGSSSIRLWDSIAADMAPWPVIRRGYGGARYADLCHFAPRLVARHDPRAIVVFSANDLADPAEAPPVDQVMLDVRATLAGIRGRHPHVPVFFIAVTPTEARWGMWPRIARLNAALEALAAEAPATFFIATAERFLDPATGRPRPDLFVADRLHLSPAGYAVWAAAISAALEEVLAEAPTAAR